MSSAAFIPVDLEVTPLGTRSRLADELCGVPVLRRTVERVARCEKLDRVVVACPPEQRERCEQLLSGLDVQIQPVQAPPPPWRNLVASARKWSLDSWRGGIGGSTCFDEYTDARVIAGVLGSQDFDAVLVVPPAAIALDPYLADRMIAHGCATSEESKLTFAQTPPGLSGLVLNGGFIQELAEQSIPVGWVFSYKPDTPLKDLVFQPCCYEVPPEVRYAMGRLLADTDRGVARLTRLLTAYADPDARTTGRWLLERDESHVDPLPREIEIELTTDDPYPGSILRPRGPKLERSGVMDIESIERLIDDWMRFDDALLVLGGFGDPLRHPDFVRVLSMIHPGLRDSARGVCVGTTAVDLDDARIDALIEYPPDVLTVLLDAWSDETYAGLQSPDDPALTSIETVVANVDSLNDRRIAQSKSTPIVVAAFTKARQNVHELDAFHDGWIRKVGAVCITGASHYAGQGEDYRVVNMAPPERTPCRRIFSRSLILCDGRVVRCDQDFKGLHPAGSITDASLESIWTGSKSEVNEAKSRPVVISARSSLFSLRAQHARNELEQVPLCSSCDEWHRP